MRSTGCCRPCLAQLSPGLLVDGKKSANILASDLSLAVKRVRWQGIQRDVFRGPWYNKDLGNYSLAVSYRIFTGNFP